MSEHNEKSEPVIDGTIYARYLSHHRFLNEAKKGMNENLAKTILTFSSAAMVLAFTDLLKNEVNRYIVFASIIMFSLAIGSIVVSYLVGKNAIDDQIEASKGYFLNKEEYIVPKSALWHDRLLSLSSMLFLSGIVCIAISVVI